MSIWVINRRNVDELGGWASGLGLRSCANPDWSSGPLEASVKSLVTRFLTLFLIAVKCEKGLVLTP